jgi:hypothetical protein
MIKMKTMFGYSAFLTGTLGDHPWVIGALGGVVVKGLRYKPAGRAFDSRWFHWNFSVI